MKSKFGVFGCLFLMSIVGTVEAFAAPVPRYKINYRPESELSKYIQQKPLEINTSAERPLYETDVWKQDEVKYRDLDALNSRYTSQEKEITSDGILGSGLKKEFTF